MRRRLIIMRHAKSSWKSEAATDHARPLKKRGRRDAPRIAQELVDLGWAPAHVLSSDALRTRQTFEHMAPLLGDVPVEFASALYLGGVPQLRAELLSIPNDADPLLILGHNPGCEEMVRFMTGECVTMPTAAAALLIAKRKFGSWPDAAAGKASFRIERLLRPKEL